MFSRFDGVLFLGSFALGLVIHMYMLTHKMINLDDVGGMYEDLEFALTSGRFLLGLLSGMSASFSSPWLNGVLSAFFLAMGVVFTLKLFGVRHYLSAFLLAATMIGFPVVASTLTYMFTAFEYMFALAFAALGAYCIAKERIPWLLGGSVAVALATGCYQAYFPFAATLVLTSCMLDLSGGRWDNDWKRGMLAAVKYVLALALGMVLYMVILKICLLAKGWKLTNYQGISNWSDITPAVMLERAGLAYEKFFAFYRNDDALFLDMLPALAWISMGAGCVLVGRGIVKSRGWRAPVNLLLVAACVALFPLGSALSYLMTDEFVHHVMKYSFVVTLLFPALLADRLTLPPRAAAGTAHGARRKIAVRRALTATFAALLLVAQLLTGYEGFLVSNRAYFMMDMSRKNASSYFDRLVETITLQEGYTPEREVALLGQHRAEIWIPEVYMTGAAIGNTLLNIYSLRMYLVYYHNFWLKPPSWEKQEALIASAEFQEMPVYPAEGSVRTIDDVIVVKLHPPYEPFA